MAETLQSKVACDTCASSDVELAALAGDDKTLLIVLKCKMEHRTEVWVQRRSRNGG